MNEPGIGQFVEVQGSAAKPYIVKNVDGLIWSCTCASWRNCGGKVERKSCKHIRAVRGSASEDERLGGPTAVPPLPAPSGFGDVRVASHVDAAYAQTVLDRAASEGRKLRQDEKAKLEGPALLLAHKFEDVDVDPTGWWWSEKLDGCRAMWDGKRFISRQGNEFFAPSWFKHSLPNEVLDGELYCGRQRFQQTMSIVRTAAADDRWRDVKYVMFDHPRHGGTFEARLNAVVNIAVAANVPHVVAHPHEKVLSLAHLRAKLDELVKLGAEGLMIRKPGSLYVAGRSDTLLKVKPWQDDDAVVVAHEPGKGKHKGRLGGLVLRMPNGKEFNVGTGFTDDDRRNPPPIGSTVTYKFTEHTNDGIPKCASFVRVRPEE